MNAESHETYEVYYRYLSGHQPTCVGILVGMNPVDWWERNKEWVDLLQWMPVDANRAEGVETLPLVIERTTY